MVHELRTIRFYGILKIIISVDEKCHEKCEGQEWDKGFNDMVPPCGNNFWNKLMSNDKVSFAFESCYDSYPIKIPEIHSGYHCYQLS